ncbi:hypothetical protein H3281_27965, partial [Escherichia coli]|nr:hypothetical protein [Escherichia coli]
MRRRVASIRFQPRSLQRAALAVCATALLTASLCMAPAQHTRAADLR